MRSYPNSWTKTLTQLGFRRKRTKSSRRSAMSSRMSRIEQLECRQLLTGDPIRVTTLVDENNGVADGVISLREAILNAASYNNAVEFDASLSGGRIVLSGGQLNITQPITITGPGADKLTVDAQGQSRVFQVGNVGTVTFSGFTITGAGLTDNGGGILNEGSLTLEGVVVADNQAAYFGGGVYTTGPYLLIQNSTIDGNRSGWGAGVMANLDPGESIEIKSSTISGNVADDAGSANGQIGGLCAGNVAAATDALGNVTTFNYDALGRLVESKLPNPINGTSTGGPTTTNKYDIVGNRIETIDPNGNATQFFHDKLGRVVQTQTLANATVDRASPSRTALGVNTTLAALTTTDFDAVGNVSRSAVYDVSKYSAAQTPALASSPRTAITPQNLTDNLVQAVSYRYDAFGRPIRTLHAETAPIATTTRTEYDAAGRVRFQYDELNRVTEYRYDSFGRLVTTLLADPATGAITSSSSVTTYQYDNAGNQTAVADPRGFTTRFEFDAFNRLHASTDALRGRSRSVYDTAGQLVGHCPTTVLRQNYFLAA